MTLSISTLTANRLLAKAVIRVSGALGRLKELIAEIEITEPAFEILQVLIADKPSGFAMRMAPKKGSQLMQVKVGLPEGLTFRPEMDPVLLEAIGDRVAAAAKASGASQTVVKSICEKVELWKRENSRERTDH